MLCRVWSNGTTLVRKLMEFNFSISGQFSPTSNNLDSNPLVTLGLQDRSTPTEFMYAILGNQTWNFTFVSHTQPTDLTWHSQDDCLGFQYPRWLWVVDPGQLEPEWLIQGNIGSWMIPWVNFFCSSCLGGAIETPDSNIQGNWASSAEALSQVTVSQAQKGHVRHSDVSNPC